MTRELVRLGAATSLLVAAMCVFPVSSDDIFMYLAIARRAMATGHFPATDPFLFSLTDYHWHVLHEWLNHLAWYAVYTAGGWNGVILAKTALVVCTAALPFWVAARLGGAPWVTALVVTAAAFAGSHRFIERSSLFSDAFMAVTLAVLLVARARQSALVWVLPGLFLLWVNLHPGFYPGLFLCAWSVIAWLPGRRDAWYRKHLLGAVALSFVACLANPRGLDGALHPLQSLGSESWEAYRTFNFEWMPTLDPRYRSSLHVSLFVALSVTIAAILALWRRHRPWFELGATIAVVALGFSAIRFVSTASWCLAVLGASMSSALATTPRTSRRLGWAALLVVLGLTAKVAWSGYDTVWGPRTMGLGLQARLVPEGAAAFVETLDPAVRVFNQHEYGAYLAWRWDGARQLMYHGFADLDFYARDYLPVNRSRADFDRITSTYNIGAFMLKRYDASAHHGPLLFRLLYGLPEWHLVYSDRVAQVFLRDIPENRDHIARYSTK